MIHNEDGRTLDVGRRTRVVPPALRRALEHRDRGCRFPGCANTRCDAHHIVHWCEGGETRADNLVLLCRRHHRALHEEGFRVTVTADPAGGAYFRFSRPDGTPIPQVPPAEEVSEEDSAAARRGTHTVAPEPPAWTDWDPFGLGMAIDAVAASGSARSNRDTSRARDLHRLEHPDVPDRGTASA